MRKSLLFLFFALSISITVKSQNISFNVGLGISNTRIEYFNTNYISDKLPIFSPDVGIAYEYFFNERISIKPGISYSRHGKLNVTDFGSGVYLEEKFTINYIDFPLLFAYNFNTRTMWGYSLNISAGPYVGMGFNGIITLDNRAVVEQKKIFIGESGVERNDFGLLFRVGFGYTRDQISASFAMGLKNLAKIGGDYTEFKRMGVSINYVRKMDFGPNSIRMIKRRFF